MNDDRDSATHNAEGIRKMPIFSMDETPEAGNGSRLNPGFIMIPVRFSL